ncbi:Immediate-early protein 2 [Streptomyces orinoci]|uniref:SRPBCC family protein n=1 Tax=Streptomyces orinoci TaxID=67339 RepID=A0ABV3K4X7_STRON|nr:Immediate-early protein 2 [Streptomyces orinoci]
MAVFRIECDSPLPAADAWGRLTSWPAQAAHVPFTRITVCTPPPPGVGTRFVARTGRRPLAFDDPMVVTHWQPPSGTRPGRCRVEKRGRALTGWAEIEVYRNGPGCRVIWREEVRIVRAPRLLDRCAAAAGRLVFGRMVRRLVDAKSPRTLRTPMSRSAAPHRR